MHAAFLAAAGPLRPGLSGTAARRAWCALREFGRGCGQAGPLIYANANIYTGCCCLRLCEQPPALEGSSASLCAPVCSPRTWLQCMHNENTCRQWQGGTRSCHLSVLARCDDGSLQDRHAMGLRHAQCVVERGRRRSRSRTATHDLTTEMRIYGDVSLWASAHQRNRGS